MDDAARYRVIADPEFQRMLERDPELAALEKDFYSDNDDAEELRLISGGVFVLTYSGGILAVVPPPPGVFAFLWAAGSPFLRGGSVRRGDVLLALHALARGRLACAGGMDAALAFAVDELTDADYAPLADQISEVFTLSLRPYATLLPDSRSAGERATEREARLDGDWLAGLALRVHRAAGLTADAVM